jgi:uncharacterized protein (UPF0305 family)
MTRYEELREEMWEAYRENIRFIKTHNVKKFKDESQDIQDENKRLEKILHEKEQLCMDEARRMGMTRIILKNQIN